MKICSDCGQKAEKKDKVCSACGGALTEKNRVGFIAAIIIMIVLIGGAIGYGIYQFTDESEAPAADVKEKNEPKEEETSDTLTEEEEEEVKALAEEALELIVIRNQDALMDKMGDSNPQAPSNADVVSKLRSYNEVAEKFESLIDSLEITEEQKKELKEYGYEKVNAVYAKFCAEGIRNVKVNSNGMVVASAKADILNTSDVEYNLIYNKIAEYSAGKELNDMTAEEIKSVIDKLFNDIESYIVDTDVVLQYKKVDEDWKINYVGISAAE